jgi:hypothetical protein
MEEKKAQEFHFFVDAKKYETAKSSLTGAEIKQIASVEPTYQLFLEGEDNEADKPISDLQGIAISGGTKHFYAVPPATFGCR